MRKKLMDILECGGRSDTGVMMKLLYITPEYYVNSRSLTSLFHSLNKQVEEAGISNVFRGILLGL